MKHFHSQWLENTDFYSKKYECILYSSKGTEGPQIKNVFKLFIEGMRFHSSGKILVTGSE